MNTPTNMPCRICGRAARGRYYGVLACVGCRSFYRRCLKKPEYGCYAKGNCTTDEGNFFTRCKGCRFKKYNALRAEATAKTETVSRRNQVWASGCATKENRCPDGNGGILSNALQYDSDASNSDSSSITNGTPSEPRHNVDDKAHPLSLLAAAAEPVEDTFAMTGNPWNMEKYGWEWEGMDGNEQNAGFIITNEHWYLNNRLLPFDLDTRQFAPYHPAQMANPEANRLQIAATIYHVYQAVETVFSDQISQWNHFMKRALQYDEVVRQPETNVNEIVLAINDHSEDNLKRTLRFMEMLPGIKELDISARQSMVLGWKALVCYLIHHAPFATNIDTYFTIGQRQLHHCMYWQKDERVTNWSFQMFFYKFCTQIRDLRLEEAERYLLIAIILLEPGDGIPNLRLSIIHRHYTDALLTAIRQRCVSPGTSAHICGKIVRFFDKVKVVQRIMDRLYHANATVPPCSVKVIALLSKLNKNPLHNY